jgi:integrase
MAIQRAPLKTDTAGKCTRWRVIIYNSDTHKHEWHTVNGTRKEAQAFERQQKNRLASGVYIAKTDRRTFAEVVKMFLKERRSRNRRTSTLACYETVLDCHLTAQFGPREVGKIRRADVAEFFNDMREGKLLDEKGKPKPPATVGTINRALRTMKAVLFFALERELVERNVLQRFRPFEGGKDEPHVKRGAFTELEVRAILEAAEPRERALIGMLCFTGLRPGEAYALDWSAVDLEAGQLKVLRSWDHRGLQFVEPKTRAGARVVPLSGWLVTELTAHKERSSGEGLVFANQNGKPMNPSNTRRDIWLPLRKRAGVRDLDLYSLRHTFASLGRTAGESAFNVARMMGHSRSSLVDSVYAHSMQSGMASVAESVTARALGTKTQLRVIEGGKTPDVRRPLDGTAVEEQKTGERAAG